MNNTAALLKYLTALSSQGKRMSFMLNYQGYWLCAIEPSIVAQAINSSHSKFLCLDTFALACISFLPLT
jgi:hypothetical protein